MRGIARFMLWAALGILFYIRAVSGVDNRFWPLGVLLAAASYPALIALLAGRGSRRWLLAVVVVLYLLPYPIVGWQWEWMPWTVAAAVLCTLPPRWAWPLFALIVGGTGAVAALTGKGGFSAIWYAIVTADDGLIVFSVAALAGTVERLGHAREELARLALLRERLRLEGELRDVLGGRVQAIAFRLRKAGGAPEEIREATELARRTLAKVRETAGAYRVAAPPKGPSPVEPRLARRVLLAVLAIQSVLVLTNLYFWMKSPPLTLALVLAGLVALLVAYALPPTRVTFVVQSLLILVPLAVIPEGWDRLLSFFTGTVLLRVRPPLSWLIVGATLAAHLTYLLNAPDTSTFNALAGFGGHVMLMWLVYSLGRLTELATALDRARYELAEAAVRRERTRVAGDLHDVLGHSLTAVALQGEVAGRLPGTDLAPLIALVDRTVAELDAIVGDRVALSLPAEITAAVGVLESAGVETEVRMESPELPAGAETVLATILRESVTNILRHSRARTCEITVGPGLRLRVVNDGAGDPAGSGSGLGGLAFVGEPAGSGSGLGSLARRTGGRLTAGLRPGGRFVVIAEFGSDPAGLVRDPDGVDPVAGAQLGDGRAEIVADGAVGEEEPLGDLGGLGAGSREA